MQEKTGMQQILEWLLHFKSYKLLYLIIVSYLIFNTAAVAEQVKLPASVTTTVAATTNVSVNFKMETYRFTDEEYVYLKKTIKEPIRRRIPYYQVWAEEQSHGIILLDKIKGKFDWIFYWVWVDSTHEILAVRIYKHHENRGKRISSKIWLRQFVGIKSVNTNLLNDIDDVTGATVSSHAVILGVQRSMEYLKYCLNNYRKTSKEKECKKSAPAKE